MFGDEKCNSARPYSGLTLVFIYCRRVSTSKSNPFLSLLYLLAFVLCNTCIFNINKNHHRWLIVSSLSNKSKQREKNTPAHVRAINLLNAIAICDLCSCIFTNSFYNEMPELLIVMRLQLSPLDLVFRLTHTHPCPVDRKECFVHRQTVCEPVRTRND